MRVCRSAFAPPPHTLHGTPHDGYEPASSPVDSLSFEQAIDELDQLVRKMESGELSLDESVAAYRRGAELGQGFHISPPLPLADSLAWIRQQAPGVARNP